MQLGHVFLAAGFLLLLGGGAHAEETSAAKRSDIRKLMEATGSFNLPARFAAAASQSIFRALKAERPELHERALEVMQRELVALFAEQMNAPGGLVEKVVPVYDKHFTHQEIREILSFYQTGTGRKAIAVLPRVISESMLIGQDWAESLGPEIDRRIDAALRREKLLTPQQ
jgi:hypothetical protein